MRRTVEPEILDELAPDDPAAVRSRRDLRLINWLMGGEKWITRQVLKLGEVKKIIELGAGTGRLSGALKEELPDCEVVALDRMPRPEQVRDDVVWESVNVMDYGGFDDGCVVVANLFVHHLRAPELEALGEKLKRARAVVFAEPNRIKSSLRMGRLLFPFINYVTRADMITSIKAGFILGEMESLLGPGFKWSEDEGVFGGLRMMGERG